jgi:alkylation response protein AidB-like acyl-CoA dehydrogenase
MSKPIHNATADEARELAESSRQSSWAGRSVMKEIFLGRLHVDWVAPYPETPYSEAFLAWYEELRTFLETRVDGPAIDAAGQLPDHVIQGLRDLGAFGMKIPKEYGGLGFKLHEYAKALELVAYHDGNLIALLSAAQSIGVPNPVLTFGTEEQKRAFLPRCAKGAVSAFALTEPDVGSDPARLATTAERDENGDYVINGVKLWITNGTIAELFVVMARHPESRKISAFIVEASTPGISVDHKCRFMGLRALENGVIRFDNVRVPKENLLSKEGAGLRIALTTLNTGRLSLPAACAASSRNALGMARSFASERVQWGAPVGKHEAVTHKLADMAATTFAIETLSHLANELAMREGYDIRLEASAAKEYCTVRNWELLDEALQVRGGRGYETELSLRERGEAPMGIERALRDSRINRIFEGSSEIMHLFMAREALDTHLQVAQDFLYAKTAGDRLKALPKMIGFYSWWYPSTWLGLGTALRYGEFGSFAGHLRFAERRSRKLARSVFHGMVRFQAGLEKKQAFLFRAVDIAMELLVITAVVARAHKLAQQGDPNAAAIAAVADLHCRNARRIVDQRFAALWRNDDVAKTALGHAIVDGAHLWVEGDAPITSFDHTQSSASAAAK